ncbi:MAG TPA: hypothetical protein VK543_16385 [Puia sp.]|nr:hypothetical protein [Puia sp.]
MKCTIDASQYGMAEINEQEAMTAQGGDGLLKFVGQLIGLAAGAMITDLIKVYNGQPVTMPAGERAMYSALG